MSRLSLVLFFLWSTLFLVEIWLPLAEGTCRSNFDCRSNFFSKVCCYGSCSGNSCVGKFCLTDGDCGGKDECCSLNVCGTYGCTECRSNFDCGLSEYCCKHRYHNDHNVCRRSCAGETCHSSDDCGGPKEYCTWSKECRRRHSDFCTNDNHCTASGECCRSYKCVTTSCSPSLKCSLDSHCASSKYCCERGNLTNECRTTCVGEKCFQDKDCGGPQEFCNMNTTKCEKSDNTLPSWVLPVVVPGIILLIIIGCAAFWGCSCRGKSTRGTVVQERPARGTAAIIALRETEIRAISSPPQIPVYNSPPPYYNHGQDTFAYQTHQMPPHP